MKVLSLILAILFLSLSTFARQTSGPVVNSGSVSIEADDDADNDGKVVFKTKHVERLAIDNDGKLSIGAGGGSAIINVNTLPPVGAVDVLSMPIHDGATAAGSVYGFRFNSFPQGFGNDPRHDNTLFFGYNPGSQTVGEPSFGWNMENRYVTSQGRYQSEMYFESSVPGKLYSRPIGIDVYHDNGETQVSLNTPRLLITEGVQQQNVWLEFLSSPTSGKMTFYGNSEISFAGTKKYFMSHVGTGIIGRDLSNSRVWNLVQGGAQNETLHVFEADTVTNGPLAIKIGSEGLGLVVGSSSKGLYRMQGNGEFPGLSDFIYAYDVDAAPTANKIVQRDSDGAINVSALKINGVQMLGVPCAPIADVADIGVGGIGESGQPDNSKTINKMLQCLRDQKLLLPSE